MLIINRILLVGLLSLFAARSAHAQSAPKLGYLYPPGGQAGQTVEVILGGYDWTPDMEFFVHDQRIKLEMIEPPGPVIVPEPPYWFGKKSRRSPFLMPREARARLTIPANFPAGVVRWQAANANGATATGRFMVGNRPELLELDDHTGLQSLAKLPVTISGQIKKIEEVDRYQLTAEKSGPVTCSIVAREIGSPLNAAIEIHDSTGRKIASAFDTAGNDTALTFSVEAGQVYTLSLYDIDFRGNRSFVYRLSLIHAPRVIAAIPAMGQRGQTQSVELVGFGIATGAAELESVTQEITFPNDKSLSAISYQLETPHGVAPVFSIPLSHLPETIETDATTRILTSPIAVTGVLRERFVQDVYVIEGKKGDVWDVKVIAQEIGSPLDVALTILDAEGKELARSDDLANSTDAALQFAVPVDGKYSMAVSDFSGKSGSRAAVYRLSVKPAKPAFTLTVPEFLNVPLGEKAKLALKMTRSSNFKEPVAITFSSLPEGVTVPEGLEIPAGKSALNVELEVSADSSASAALVMVHGQAMVDGQALMKQSVGPILMATVLKPPFSIDAEGKDDVTKWPRGTTFPAPVLISRDEGFNEDIVLEMAAKQGRHRQGIHGPELTVLPGVERILYPVFLPEWLETTRTSRMVVNGVAKVTDPGGNVRYSLTRQKTRMGFLPTGALLKMSADVNEFRVNGKDALYVPLSIRRAKSLTESARIELLVDDLEAELFTSEPFMATANQSQILLPIVINSPISLIGEHDLTIRATVLQNGELPVVSETRVIVDLSQ